MRYFVGALVLLVVVWAIRWWTPATFTLPNESGQNIRSLTIEVGGKTFHYAELPPGGEVSGSFHVSQEEVFDVRGQYADGQEFHEWCGYVVWEEYAPHTNIFVRAGGGVTTLRTTSATPPP